MKIYTKTGDKGKTSLYNGVRVSKSDSRIELVGNLDELNSYIGFLVSLFDSKKDTNKILVKQLLLLVNIQNILFEIGSEIANPDIKIKKDCSEIIIQIEYFIDELSFDLPQLKNFILPGGCLNASVIHITRSFTRKIERLFVKNNRIFSNKSFLVLLNRLSDYFFMLARFVNRLEGNGDTLWQQKMSTESRNRN